MSHETPHPRKSAAFAPGQSQGHALAAQVLVV